MCFESEWLVLVHLLFYFNLMFVIKMVNMGLIFGLMLCLAGGNHEEGRSEDFLNWISYCLGLGKKR